jgi:transcriptional regulator GlxA family with amidase domain
MPLSDWKRVRLVAELHDYACSFCGESRATNPKHIAVAIWTNTDWVSGANPRGVPVVSICQGCFELAHIGPLVKE